MRVIGVTGGIGSGKSAVSRILSGFGAKVVDADVVAREVVQKGGKALEELIVCFGYGILDENGQLDRKKLAILAFNNGKILEDLNAITHKYIADKIKEHIHILKKDTVTSMIVLDAPIPAENGFLDVVDEVWVVTAHIGTRLKRIMERSGISYKEALDRINSQKSDEDYIRMADRVINNNGSIKQLRKNVETILREMKIV